MVASKRQNFGTISDNFATLSLSGTQQDIVNRKMASQSPITLLHTPTNWWTLVHKRKNRTGKIKSNFLDTYIWGTKGPKYKCPSAGRPIPDGIGLPATIFSV